jgi:hypothetical protein
MGLGACANCCWDAHHRVMSPWAVGILEFDENPLLKGAILGDVGHRDGIIGGPRSPQQELVWVTCYIL